MEVKKFVFHKLTVSDCSKRQVANVAVVSMGKPLVKLYLWYGEYSVRLKCPVPNQMWGHPSIVTICSCHMHDKKSSF